MRRTTRALLLTGILLIASVMAAAVAIGCKHSSPAPMPTPLPSVAATPTATAQPNVTATPTPTKSATATAKATPTATKTSVPTSTPPGTTSASISTPTLTPTPAAKAQTIVSISTPASVKQGSSFTISINITNVSCLALASLGLQFNGSCISYSSCNVTSRIGSGSGTVHAGIIQPGLLIVDIDYSDYAAAHSGNGINGSGYLCKLTFSAAAQGTSQLAFVKDEGGTPGEVTLVKWAAYNQSEIENVSLTNSLITIVP